jgi:DNA repair protein RecN (Recombination protein N)
MLRFLRIRHLAVIDAVEVEFGPGLNVLTGETGAGKSILVEAIGLLLGGRASGDFVRTGEETASVEAIFENGGEELLIRREITAQGRSRAFINGALATASALKELSGRLIELHGQHEHQTLLDPSTHLVVLDVFGGLGPLVDSTRVEFAALRSANERLERLRQSTAERLARQEFAAFQLAELDRAGLATGEDVELAATKQVLASAERVERLCTEGYAALYDGDGAALSDLSGVWRRVGELAALDSRFQPYLEARDGIKSQLEDLALFLRRYAQAIEASPARLQQVDDRLALLERLKRKYGPTLREAVAKREALREELAGLAQHGERTADLERDQAEAQDRYLAAARALAAARRRAAADFARRLEALIAEFAMERTRFEVRFDSEALPAESWTEDGLDRAEFYVSPNPGEDLKPLARIVSGGELSRIMLAIKTLAATSRYGLTDAPDRTGSAEAPGLVFDEVDAGIGGRVAEVVGGKLRALGSAFQVLCITHLPQIAAAADTHFRVEKRVEAGRTLTRVTRLETEARIDEIGRMLAGSTLSDGIRASASELLAARQGWPAAAGRPREPRAKGESKRAKAKRP